MQPTDPPTPREFARTLLPALRQAAAIARALEGRVANHPKQDEASPAKAALTLADTAAQEALLVPLLQRFRAARLDAEERTPSVARFSGEAEDLEIVVDPIDGTLRFFLQALGPYAVMIGLARASRYQAALLALPREGLFFEAVREEGARRARGTESFEPVRAGGGGRRVLVSHGAPPALLERLRREGFEPSFGCGGAIAVAPLLPDFCGGIRLANPGGSISRRGRIGLLISAEAGARIRTGSGTAFPEHIDAPEASLVVAGNDEVGHALGAVLAGA